MYRFGGSEIDNENQIETMNSFARPWCDTSSEKSGVVTGDASVGNGGGGGSVVVVAQQQQHHLHHHLQQHHHHQHQQQHQLPSAARGAAAAATSSSSSCSTSSSSIGLAPLQVRRNVLTSWRPRPVTVNTLVRPLSPFCVSVLCLTCPFVLSAA